MRTAIRRSVPQLGRFGGAGKWYWRLHGLQQGAGYYLAVPVNLRKIDGEQWMNISISWRSDAGFPKYLVAIYLEYLGQQRVLTGIQVCGTGGVLNERPPTTAFLRGEQSRKG